MKKTFYFLVIGCLIQLLAFLLFCTNLEYFGSGSWLNSEFVFTLVLVFIVLFFVFLIVLISRRKRYLTNNKMQTLKTRRDIRKLYFISLALMLFYYIIAHEFLVLELLLYCAIIFIFLMIKKSIILDYKSYKKRLIDSLSFSCFRSY